MIIYALVLFSAASTWAAQEFKILDTPVSEIRPHLSAPCAAKLAAIEAAAVYEDGRPLSLQALICGPKGPTLRLLDPIGKRVSTELIFENDNPHFREHLYPNAGNEALEFMARSSLEPDLAMEILRKKALEFYYPFTSDGRFDIEALFKYEGELLKQVPMVKTDGEIDAQIAADRARGLAANAAILGLPLNIIPGEITREERVAGIRREYTYNYSIFYRTAGISQTDNGAIAKPLHTAIPRAYLSSRFDIYVPMVKKIQDADICRSCAAEFSKIVYEKHGHAGSFLTNPDADSTPDIEEPMGTAITSP